MPDEPLTDDGQAIKRRIAGLYDRVSPHFDRAGPAIFGYFAQELVHRAGIAPGMTVLDLACGSGANLLPAAQHAGPTGRAVGVDISATIAREALDRLREAGADQAATACMDGENLGFATGTFDAVVCGFAVFYFPDLARALAEVQRVLKPGGVFASSVVANESPFTTWLRASLDAHLPPDDEDEDEDEENVHQNVEAFGDPEWLAARWRAAGWQDVHADIATGHFVFGAVEEFLAMVWSCGTRHSMEALAAADRLAAYEAHVARDMAARRRADGFHMPPFNTICLLARNPAAG